MNNKSYKASCPICGRVLLSGTENSELELYCPKCKTKLNVNFKVYGVTVTVMDNSNITIGGVDFGKI